MEAPIYALDPGTHAIHLHEKADCSSSDGKSTGGTGILLLNNMVQGITSLVFTEVISEILKQMKRVTEWLNFLQICGALAATIPSKISLTNQL